MGHGTEIRRYGNWILGVALAAVLSLAGGRAFASTPYAHLLSQADYLADFNLKYQTVGTVLDTCRLCHPSYPLSNSTNGFGVDFADSSIGNHTFNGALGSADSDGDGFSNLYEISERTFPGNPASMPRALTGLWIDGPAFVNEGEGATYTAWASWDNGTTRQIPASWSVSPSGAATIDGSGYLAALTVTSDQPATLTAAYFTQTATYEITIVDVPAPPPPPATEISVMPLDGAEDVPVTTVVTVMADGSADIASLVNADTFTLAVAGGAAVVSTAEAGTCGAGGVLAGTFGYNDAGTQATFTPLCKLAYATTYAATIRPPSGADLPAPGQALAWTFTTVAETPDSDGDGVPDGEDAFPHNPAKATPPSPRGTGKFLVDACGNAGIGITLERCADLVQAEGISDMYPQFNRKGKPFGFDFPDGLVKYTLTGFTPGATVTVTVNFPSGVPHGSRVFKVDADGFQQVLDAVVDGDRITVTLTDGGSGDADGVANGVIVDPIGVAVPSAGSGSIDLSSTAGGGGCSVAGSGERGTGALGFLAPIALAGVALVRMRRKTAGRA